MALKEYVYRGRTYQFEEGKQPAEAVEVREAKAKQATPQNKARKPKEK